MQPKIQNVRKHVFCVNPYPADHDYCRFSLFLLVSEIAVIGNEMCVQISSFANICATI